MNFSEKWLREWANPSITTTQLCEQLTQAGLETDIVYTISKKIKNIVVGEIVNSTKCILNSHYTIYIVYIGKKKYLKVISKNLNYSIGTKIVIATLESTLGNGKKISIIDLKKIGSEGIFCSFSDLGIFPYNNTIIELPKETIVGIDVLDTILFNDTLIKVSTVLNRLNEINILGLAREVSVLNNLTLPSFSVQSPVISSKKTVKINIDLKYKYFCYLGRIIENVDLNMKTPFWIIDKLRRCHVYSKNIIMDIINYIRIEIGESLHILDLQTIVDNNIFLKHTKSTELVTLYNDKQVSLKKGTIIISDISKTLVLGNNFNAKKSFVNQHTQDLFIGSLYLSPFHLEENIKNNNVDEKIIDYFQYSVNLKLQNNAIDYATNLILKICGGNASFITAKSKGINSTITLSPKIVVQHKNINKIVGHFVNYDCISKILLSLGYNITKYLNKWEVFPPEWRIDIFIEEDVISDVIRIYGYSKIKNTLLKESFQSTQKNVNNDLLKRMKYMLVDKGYNEIITYSFVNPKIQNLINPSKKSLKILNPISKEMSVMRFSLWPGLLTTILYNQNRQQEKLRLFESGLCFSYDTKSELQVRQELFIAGAISGFCYNKTWNLPYRKVDFYDLKGDIESILELYTDLSNIEFNKKSSFALHPGQSAEIFVLNKSVGKIGVLHPILEKKINLKHNVILFELSLEKFKEKKVKEIQKISDFPSSRRDISIILPITVTFNEILKECRKMFPDKISKINVFDVYSGSKLEEGKKSLAISFVFQDIKQTLNDNQIDMMLKTCIKKLEDCFQAILRN